MPRRYGRAAAGGPISFRSGEASLESDRERAGTATPGRLAALTRLRALLIGWVVVYHLELALHGLGQVPVIGRVALKGYLGVDGFFLLSGFALYLGYHRRVPAGWAGWSGFVRRRAARIFPLHLAALFLLCAILATAFALGIPIRSPERFGAFELAMQAMLVNAWETTRIHAWNYPSWALSAIWAGYLGFPLMLRAMLAWGQGTTLLAAGTSLALLAWLGADRAVQLNLTLHLGLLRFGLEFVLGMALARVTTQRAPPAIGFAVLLLPIGLATDCDVLSVAGLAALISRLTVASSAARGDGLLGRLGEASFGIYLCWIFVETALVLVQRAAAPGPAMRIALMAAGFAATLALGWLAWRYVEQPAARRLARLID